MAKREDKVIPLPGAKPEGDLDRGYTPLGEHDPFDYCHEIIDGDGDDYTGEDKGHGDANDERY